MQDLKTALKSLEELLTNTQNTPEEQSRDLSVMPQHGLTSLDTKTIMPRKETITLERAKRGMEFLRRLKSCKRKRYAQTWWPAGQEPTFRSEYILPDGLTAEAARNGLIDLVTPCSPGVTAYFARLNACRPIYDTESIKMRFQMLYDDLKHYSEIAVVMGLEELRVSEGKYFPTNHEIIQAVKYYDDQIKDALDFFQQPR